MSIPGRSPVILLQRQLLAEHKTVEPLLVGTKLIIDLQDDQILEPTDERRKLGQVAERACKMDWIFRRHIPIQLAD